MKHDTIYYVFRYNLRSQAAAEYKQWLAKQAAGQAEQAGWTYVGTFCDVMGCDRYDYETRWELNGNGSVSVRPLDVKTELGLADRLPFVEEGQVALLKALNGVPRQPN
jgi:hypothetical protein